MHTLCKTYFAPIVVNSILKYFIENFGLLLNFVNNSKHFSLVVQSSLKVNIDAKLE